MPKIRIQHEPVTVPEETASLGRVFKFSLKGVPAVDAAMEARLKVAAQKPRKDRRYPVIVDAPDA
ncbi:MAG: hypothetical protein WA968_10905 [Castellaniella sp.]